MNYLPLIGWWFYGAATSTERAAYYCSWGMVGIASAPPTGGFDYPNWMAGIIAD